MSSSRDLFSQLRDPRYFIDERAELTKLLGSDDELLELELASVGGRRPGMLAITHTRVIHLYAAQFPRAVKVISIDHGEIASVIVDSMWSTGRIQLRLHRARRVILFPHRTLYFLVSNVDRALALAECLRTAVGRPNSANR